jgi:hypothetical protein
VTGSRNDDELLGLGTPIGEPLDRESITELVVLALYEENGLSRGTLRIEVSENSDGKSHQEQTSDGVVLRSGAEGGRGTERESPEEERAARERAREEVDGGAGVFLFPAAVVVRSAAPADAPELEAKDGETFVTESFGHTKKDLEVHGSAPQGMRVAEDGRCARPPLRRHEDGLEATRRTREIDRLHRAV